MAVADTALLLSAACMSSTHSPSLPTGSSSASATTMPRTGSATT